jgi:PAS domain S-box-containing protein
MDNLIDSASLVKEIYNSTYDYGIFTSDLEGKINTWNVGAERITGFLSNEIIGRDNGLLFTAEDRARDEPRQEMHIAKTTGRAADYRWHLRKDGSRFWADGVLTMIRDESGQHIGYLKILRDITDRKLAEVELHRIANSDMLTGLPNRFSFEAHLEEMIAMTCRSDQPMALHLILIASSKSTTALAIMLGICCCSRPHRECGVFFGIATSLPGWVATSSCCFSRICLRYRPVPNLPPN